MPCGQFCVPQASENKCHNAPLSLIVFGDAFLRTRLNKRAVKLQKKRAPRSLEPLTTNLIYWAPLGVHDAKDRCFSFWVSPTDWVHS